MPRILLVDDNADSRDMLAVLLERRGYDVISAEDGKIGVEMSYAQHPDLILMDLNMPNMSGWEAATLLRADESMRDLPIIAITGHALPGERERALRAGCTEYFTKPVE